MTRMSVIIAAHNACSVIDQCLSALKNQAGSDELEIIVVDSSSDGTDTIVRQNHPGVTLIHFDTPRTIPVMRGEGIRVSHGDIITIIDPYAVVSTGWHKALITAFAETDYSIIGGPVDLIKKQKRNLREWAIYINEYGMFMPPMSSGGMTILPGCNISYRREVLFDGDMPRFQHFWKTSVNEETSRLWLESAAVVSLNKPIPFGGFLQSRYDHGRCFAGMRETGRVERLLRLITAPVLPFVFLWRWGRHYFSKGMYRSKFVLTLPHQFILFGNWARGELAGYLRGTGHSCEKLFY